MEELRLTRPTEAMSGEISAYRQAMLDAGSEMDGCGPLSRMEDPAEWIAFCKTLDEGTNVPERWVPATQFVCLRGAKIAVNITSYAGDNRHTPVLSIINDIFLLWSSDIPAT